MIDFNDFKCPFMDKQEIDARADEYHQDYWGKDELPVDIELVIERVGLDIIPVAILDTIDAYLNNRATAILVNIKTYDDDRYGNRVRFSLAHELGHYALHRTVIEQMEFNSIEQYHDFIRRFPQKEYEFFEYQAHEFAGRLLVPVGELRSEIRKISGRLQTDELKGILQKEPEQVLSYAAIELCKPFAVSADVIKRRVVKEGLWPPR